MRRILVNTRILGTPVTGVQRYTQELLSRWNDETDTISPERDGRGGVGHAWEQVVLPSRIKGRLLFSPSNTGPLAIRNQVVTIHDMAVCDHPEFFSSQFAKWYRFLLPNLVRRVRHVIAVSDFTKNRIIACTGVNDAKITVVHNAVADRFCPEAGSGLYATKSDLALPCERYILGVSSLEPRKNLKRLLRAWARVESQLPEDLWLVLVGGVGNERVFAGVEMQELPARVHFTGRVDDHLLPSLYAGALAFTYVSVYEGFGLPVLEAMASGAPVIAGNRSSLPEVVADAGLLVDPFDEEAIAERIRTIVGDAGLRQKLSELGVKRAEKFSWDETARRTWHVLQAGDAN